VYLQHAPLSVSLALTLVVLMVLFPLFGGSVILILLVEKIAAWGRRRYAAG
jgi:preprotein translocase subunit SecY